jgi:hypothetical protein
VDWGEKSIDVCGKCSISPSCRYDVFFSLEIIFGGCWLLTAIASPF